MRRGIVNTVVAAVVGSVVLAAGAGASALWSDSDTLNPPPFGVGGVMFAAQPYSTAGSSDYSSGTGTADAQGVPVQVTLPGSVIAQVLQGPVVWQFTVTGAADGIAGLDYDVSYPEPPGPENGVVKKVIEKTTMKVYEASPGGDCSNIPSTAPTATDGTIDIPDNTLQAPAAYNDRGAAPTTTQIWCVSLVFDGKPPQGHTNVATATATASDGSRVYGTGEFQAEITYPNTLDSDGTHTNTASVAGQAVNGSWARDSDTWSASLFPDPNAEPSIPITITPTVTNANPAGPAGSSAAAGTTAPQS